MNDLKEATLELQEEISRLITKFQNKNEVTVNDVRIWRTLESQGARQPPVCTKIETVISIGFTHPYGTVNEKISK